MKVGIYTDAHFSVSSSILNTVSGYKYSARLDFLIESFKWMYEKFKEEGVSMIFNCGDLIDSNLIKAREGSALAEALSYGGEIPEYHIVGNHEKEDKGTKLNSLTLLDKNRRITVISEPTKLDDTFTLIPFTADYESLDLEPLRNKVLLSHLNYEGMKLGKITLSKGLNMDYAKSCFDLILNGHIHTPSTYKDTVVNIGSMFGHGFDDTYDPSYPSIMILDTETLKFRRIVNPYSVLFYKLRATSVGDLAKQLKPYANNSTNPKCLKVEVPHSIRDEIREYLDSDISTKLNIVATRIQGRVEDSRYIQNSEEIVKLQGYESGAAAMMKYVDIQSDESLPAPKKSMMDFINEYLV